jgi:hypothetical protein
LKDGFRVLNEVFYSSEFESKWTRYQKKLIINNALLAPLRATYIFAGPREMVNISLLNIIVGFSLVVQTFEKPLFIFLLDKLEFISDAVFIINILNVKEVLPKVSFM